jgi:hypothetical protein
MQPVRVDEMRPRHAQLAGRGIHQAGKVLAWEPDDTFRQQGGHVVGRIGEQRLQGEVDTDRGAGLEPDLAGRRRSRGLADSLSLVPSESLPWSMAWSVR